MRIDRAKKNEELLKTSKTTVESYLWMQKNMELLIQVARITRSTLFCFDLDQRGEAGMTFNCFQFWGEVMQKLEMIWTKEMFFKLFLICPKMQL